MKPVFKHLFLILIVASVFIACQRNSEPRLNKSLAVNSPQAQESGIERDETSAGFMNVANGTRVEPMLIKTGQLTVDVKSVEETRKEIDKICKELKAYISNDNQNNYGYSIQQVLTIRVDAAAFDELAKRIEGLADKVESKSISSQDVTAEFIDVDARLKTKRELSNRYHEILKQAKTVTDILAVESQIGSVQAEIESMEGRLKYLKDQVSYSTLTLTCVQNIGVDFGFGSKFTHALKNGWDNLLEFIIGLINLWPFVFLLGGGWWLFRRWRRNRLNVKS